MKFDFNRGQISLFATLFIALILIAVASARYTGFFSLPVFLNLIDDNAFLGIAAIGMTFVILSGGIDLSVGAMIGFTSIASALLVERIQLHPANAAVIVLILGALFGALQGTLIARFSVAPFLVTLAGMFFLRGAAYTLSLESVALTHSAYQALEAIRLPFGDASLRTSGIIYLSIAGIAIFLIRYTRFGRGVYAIGGNAHSAVLMGLPANRIVTLIYTLSGLCSALAGLTYAIYTSSGSATAAMGLELDVIAAVVIGGTLLTGGQGSMFGTMIGVLILGIIQTVITFEGTLSSWWTRIAIGGLLLFFVGFQKVLANIWERSIKKSPAVVSKHGLLDRVVKAAAIPGLAFALLTTSLSGLIMSSAAQAQTLTPANSFESICPPGYQSGIRLEAGLHQLTGTNLKPGDFESDDVPDPAPPYLGPGGEVEIYGSSLKYIHYNSWNDFITGGCYVKIKLDLRQPNMQGYPLQYTHPWDLRKFLINTADGESFEILLGGAMSAKPDAPYPVWPDDNQGRRIFLYRKSKDGYWLRDIEPLVGKLDNSWIGHSYGGNLIQAGMADQNVVKWDGTSDIYFFYERVSDDSGGHPFKTEMFASKISKLNQLEENSEIPIFTINNPPYPSLKRTIGGFLAEGPRPIEMKIKGKTFFIVGFSSGDFPTDSYTLNYAWSRNLEGPYYPALTRDGTDLLDLGLHIKFKYGLSWVGRPSIFRTPAGDHQMLFHAVRKDIRPDNDYQVWPPSVLGFHRSLFTVTLDTSLDDFGHPVLTLNPDRVVR